jgi:hypothetical protein
VEHEDAMKTTTSDRPDTWQIISALAFAFAAAFGYADPTVPPDAPLARRRSKRRGARPI